MAADLLSKLKHEWEVLKGEAGKDKTFCSEQEYPNEAAARTAFLEGKERLFKVNNWSDLPGINSTFRLYTPQGQPTEQIPVPGCYIKIILPGVPVENWVEIAEVQETETVAQFTVHPCPNPQNEAEETQHFFSKEASSTFRIEQNGFVLRGYQIGKNEVINNQTEQAGDRAVLNTLIAEGGWAGFQDIQWLKLTDYLAGKKELAQ
jgi:hypothetical protein